GAVLPCRPDRPFSSRASRRHALATGRVVVSGDRSSYPRRMHAPTHLRRIASSILPTVALIGLAPTTAQAATCTFDSSTATVSVSVGSGTTTLSVSAGNVVADAPPCGSAPV